MKYIDLSKKYQRLFHFNGVDFFMNDIEMAHYKDLDALITSINDDFYLWLPKAVLDAQLAEGAEFFADQKKFDAYYTAHEQFLSDLESAFEREIKANETLTRENVKKYLSVVSQSLKFFYRTEFFYTDTAYKLSESNPIIKENMMKNYYLKERSRVAIFNNVWFGENCQFKILFRKLGRQFDIDPNELKQYNMGEVLALFDGKKVDESTVGERKEARIIVAEKGKITVFSGAEVKNDIYALLKDTGEVVPAQAVSLKGIPASKGKVTGRVKVIISDPLTFDSLGKEFDKMQKGDILVAETTSPEFMPACEKAAAILANQGGLLSHAAVVSREFGIPCIVGLRYATKVFKDGDMVEVDADKGIVTKIQ